MASIRFEGVTKRYGDKTIVARFDLEIADGEFVVLVGGSGCGKSTTLRMVAGLETVTGGAIHIGERDVTHLPPRARDIAMVFQDYALYPHLSARDNMALGLKLRKLDRKPKQMSGGQRQRVAIGRAVVREPAVFLFDEPLSNLDAHLRTQMRVEIHALQRRLGTTSIYVTHDQVEAMTLGDRLVLLDRGVIQQVGRPIDVYRAPANRFVAGFIGSPPMNFFEGELAARFDAPGRPVAAGTTVGIRPQDLTLAADAPGRPTLPGHLVLAERLGGTTHLHVDIASHRVIAAVATDRDLEPDHPIELAYDPDRLHLFAAVGSAAS